MTWTPEELAEMAAADAEIEANFELTEDEIRASDALDHEALKSSGSKRNKLRERRYYMEHREAICARNRAYYAKNREKASAKKKEWYRANKEKAAERKKEWYSANREKILEKQRQYRKTMRKNGGVEDAENIPNGTRPAGGPGSPPK